MTPEQQAQFNDMKERLEKLERAENVAFIQNLERRLNFLSGSFRLSDAIDGPDETPATGEVLKWDGNRYNPAADNT